MLCSIKSLCRTSLTLIDCRVTLSYSCTIPVTRKRWPLIGPLDRNTPCRLLALDQPDMLDAGYVIIIFSTAYKHAPVNKVLVMPGQKLPGHESVFRFAAKVCRSLYDVVDIMTRRQFRR